MCLGPRSRAKGLDCDPTSAWSLSKTTGGTLRHGVGHWPINEGRGVQLNAPTLIDIAVLKQRHSPGISEDAQSAFGVVGVTMISVASVTPAWFNNANGPQTLES